MSNLNGQRILTSITGVLVLVSTVICIAFASPQLHMVLLDAYDTLFASSPSNADTARFGHLITGGVTAGWGWTLFRLSRALPQPTFEQTLSAIRQGVLLWFVLDTGGSVAIGATYNVFVNLSFGVPMLIALHVLNRSHRSSSQPELDAGNGIITSV